MCVCMHLYIGRVGMRDNSEPGTFLGRFTWIEKTVGGHA